MNPQDIVSMVLICSGAFFMIIGSVGLIRFPDFYSRAHATGKVDTLATLLIISGLMVFEGINLNTLKMVLILVFVGLTNPTATNALARAAFKAGLKPWLRKKAAPGRDEGK